ncbi:MAG TPA: hypothetical protein VMH32_26780 [Burkholderiales bacterium]|nr:hypothetical protein [Burkholderiales bacterium]
MYSAISHQARNERVVKKNSAAPDRSGKRLRVRIVTVFPGASSVRWKQVLVDNTDGILRYTALASI